MSLSANRISGSVRTFLLPACCTNRPHSSLKNDHTISINPVGGIAGGCINNAAVFSFIHGIKRCIRAVTEGAPTDRRSVVVVPGGSTRRRHESPAPCTHPALGLPQATSHGSTSSVNPCFLSLSPPFPGYLRKTMSCPLVCERDINLVTCGGPNTWGFKKS